ncbi:glutathione S-transferase family protein [Novosphingobium sp. PASSN1]|uniref:glutathione S-transferase family protein n=1 Tax=Novosphingobium sp. PASSN1 TaxID=2015561 RepID=UPI000BCF6560|nr:glutathione S-transferase family protein [Novosphingobium sp. PASSN1]OYU35730.1 MAG: hypothetical protein CFE35_09560 [Novosphingobium sp. PASSN1]
MITLYQLASSPFSEKVRRALNYKQVPFEIHEVERAAVPQGRYADVSASGKFPSIVIDGTATQDSTDILIALEAAHPAPGLYPQAPREAALAHVIEDWADESLYFYEITMRLSWEHNLEGALDEFMVTMPGIPRDTLRTMVLEGAGALVKTQGLGRKAREVVVADVGRHFAALDAMLDGRDWLAGTTLSAADLAVTAQVSALLYAAEARDLLAQYPRIAAWRARIDAIAPR